MASSAVAKPTESFAPLRRRARRRLLAMHYANKVGHIGGNLSCIDMLLVLYHQVLAPADRFVLSKGHAAGALYVTLWSMGRLTDVDLAQFHGEDTLLTGHPAANGLADVLFATGSLGHGLSFAAGLALAKKLKGEGGRIYCLTSDGEWNEGSCWEALIFAAHRRLDNLTILVDLNGLQGFGSTQEVADLAPLAEKFRAFRVRTVEVDGRDPVALEKALSDEEPGPRVVIVRTRKGSGISFMQDRMEWHYLPLSESQFQQALSEVDAG